MNKVKAAQLLQGVCALERLGEGSVWLNLRLLDSCDSRNLTKSQLGIWGTRQNLGRKEDFEGEIVLYDLSIRRQFSR